MDQTSIIVVGSINCDISFQVKDFPSINETVLSHDSLLCTGGKGLNQAISAASAGIHTAMIGCIGKDEFGDKAIQYAWDNNLDVSGLKRDAHVPTGTAAIFVNDAGQNMIAVSPGANACLAPADIEAAYAQIQRASLLVVQMEIPADTVRTALQLAAKAGVRSLLNPAPATAETRALIQFCDIISPNEREAQTLTGIYPKDSATAKRAAMRLCELGAKEVVITLGGAGYYIFTQGEGKLFPAFSVTAKDTTGAGDVFNGVMACRLARGDSLHQAAYIASAAGALSVQKPGAEGAAPSEPELQQFLDQNAP
jgi:ribokinase